MTDVEILTREIEVVRAHLEALEAEDVETAQHGHMATLRSSLTRLLTARREAAEHAEESAHRRWLREQEREMWERNMRRPSPEAAIADALERAAKAS